jgi:EAL domain-containing protein (putative c-di-GMP-specific phosphodiesterase class I)
MLRRRGDSEIEAAIRTAIERNQLFMLYQPKIALERERLVGVEALMRLNCPEFGALPPSLFIPVAERCGLIDELSEWGMRTCLRQWTSWRDQGIETNVAFNLSALTLGDVAYPDFVQRLCMLEGVPCQRLTIEVTEGTTQHIVRLLDAVTRFRIMGVCVELDDFGTGYSSLLQLKQLPFSGLKIDTCFVKDAASDPESRVIVKSVIDLAHGLGLTTTAEGVEDDATLKLLGELGCDYAQGFLISPPLEPSELAPWVMRSAYTAVPA